MFGVNRYFIKVVDRWKYIFVWYINIKYIVILSIYFVYLFGIKVYRERSNIDFFSVILIIISMLLFLVNVY